MAASLAVASCTAPSGPTSAPAHTTVPTVVRYLALGDSYTAGQGLPPFDTSTAGCHRSQVAFPALVQAGDTTDTTSRACSGATTADVLEREQHPGVGRQIDAVTAGTDLVTVTIGGNDLGFATVMSDCVFGRLPCSRLDGRVEQALTALEPRLVRLYGDVRRRAPDARLLVVGYPQLIADPDGVDVDSCPSLVALSGGLRVDAGEVGWLRAKGDRLAGVVRAAASAAGATYVDSAAAFAGHEACSADPWMAGVAVAQVALSFHPNAVGHAQLARLVSARAEG